MEDKKINVLLIEDERSVAYLIEDMLKKSEKSRFNVKWVDTLKKGLNELENNKIDIILLDLYLPDSKGLETLSNIREASSLAIVVLTGWEDTDVAVEAVKRGAEDYLIKSEVNSALLIRSLQYAVERSHIKRALKESCEMLEEKVKERTHELSESNRLLIEQIKEREEKERELLVAYKRLKETQSQLIQAEKMQVIGMLASGVAHEVKNPLAIILQGVEFLERKIDSYDENIRLTFANIKEAIKRADNIVRGLLDFSSISKIDVSTIDINSLLEECVFLLKHQFDRRQIKVIRDFGRELPLVEIDKNRIEQVFVNIFMNATYAMEKGGILRIKTYRGSNEMLIVEVEDTGCGIPEDIIDKIFDPFFTTRRDKGGAGLGLAIVRSIIEMHRGRIEIENKKEGGVRVKIFFRIRKE